MSSLSERPNPGPPGATGPPQPPRARAWTAQPIESVHRWTPQLRTIRVRRPEGLRYLPGHYARLGLPVGAGDATWRAYSFASSPGDDGLEFLVTLVRDGAFTGMLGRLGPGDPVMIESAAMGFFLESSFAPGDALWMTCTGSAIGPYVSLLREGEVLARYRTATVVHGARTAAELAYADELRAIAGAHPGRIRYLPVVTREPGATELVDRIPSLVADGRLERAAGAPIDARDARVMVCGNPAFTADMRRVLSARGFKPCRRGSPGSMLFEHYW